MSLDEEYEVLDEDEVEKIRVCMLGDNGVGKTALVSQFLTSDYIDTYDASLGKIRSKFTENQKKSSVRKLNQIFLFLSIAGGSEISMNFNFKIILS